ncbi:hypothetical protein [Aliidiomarina indica]|uniref:hypothetical protein n=1 Tax=Aliidiomarina indica TaxID=2749147 RepID=UPI00188EA9AD|nr:hypothetical protein [Aliidiomarina indica]
MRQDPQRAFERIARRRRDKKIYDRNMRVGMILVTVLISMTLVGLFTRQASVEMNPDTIVGWREVEFDSAANRFQTRIMLARLEWLRLQGPEQIRFEFESGAPITIPMQANGWPASPDGSTRGVSFCRGIWDMLASADSMRDPLRIEWHATNNQLYCRYSYGGMVRFDYYPETGHIVHHVPRG